jgi:ribonuclease P protein component
VTSSDVTNAGVSKRERLLTKRHEFLAAAKGRRFHSGHMSVQGLRRFSQGEKEIFCRLGLTVTKKVGNAPERTRIKRRLRAAWRDVVQRDDQALAKDQAFDCVVIARRSALCADYQKLVDDLRQALHSFCKRP